MCVCECCIQDENNSHIYIPCHDTIHTSNLIMTADQLAEPAGTALLNKLTLVTQKVK